MRRPAWLPSVIVIALTVALTVTWGATAGANGRFPATVSVHFQPGNDQKIFVGTTFGLLYSPDDGATWYYTCEANIGYTGIFDPVFAVSPTGALFATTPNGLGVSRDDACTFTVAPAPLGDQWIGDVTVGPDGRIWAATATGGMPNDVYVSTDDGATFTATGLFSDQGWWKTIRVAPTDPQRIYVSGYKLGMGPPLPLLYRSDDGGVNWMQIPFDFMGESQLRIVGVSPIDPDVVFARIDTATRDYLLRSANGTMSWTSVLDMPDNIVAFTARADGMTYIAGTPTQGVRVSRDGGNTWLPPAQELRMACVGERAADGALFACAANWNPDRMALGRSTDTDAWEKVIRFVEIDDQLQCPAGSGHDVKGCDDLWPGTACQFGIGKPDAGPGTPDGGPPMDGGGATIDAGMGGGGEDCGCRVGGRTAVPLTVLAFGFAGAVVLLLRRRR